LDNFLNVNLGEICVVGDFRDDILLCHSTHLRFLQI
jgi:hypothetical protein